MLIFGKVTEVNPESGKCRVTFESEDDTVSYFLQVVHVLAGKSRTAHNPDINDYVACIMDDNQENGVILGGVYNDKVKPPSQSGDVYMLKFSDNAVLSYDKSVGKLTVDGVKNIDVRSDQKVTIQCINADVNASVNIKLSAPTVTVDSPSTTFTGTVSAAGITSSAGITATGNISATGAMSVDGSIEATGDVKAGAISLLTHKHPGVVSGSSLTGTSIP